MFLTGYAVLTHPTRSSQSRKATLYAISELENAPYGAVTRYNL